MSQLALDLIRQAKAEGWTTLDLGNTGLTELPEELFELTQLETLTLSNRVWDATKRDWHNSPNTGLYNLLRGPLPEGFSKLKNLKTLHAGGSGSIYSVLGVLFIFNDYWQIDDISILSNLTNLQTLDLRSNNLSDISILSNLTNLQTLDLSYNNLSDISILSQLTNLQTLDLSSNNLSDISILSQLTNLQTLDLRSNNLSDISILSQLTNLQTLDLSSNNLSDISILSQLTNLQTLDLSYNNLSDISMLSQLTNLQTLDLRSNNLSDISPLRPLIERGMQVKWGYDGGNEGIYLESNPLEIPPVEVVKEGNAAILRYFEELDKQKLDYLYEAKLTLVGEGSAGKTSLQIRLKDKNGQLPGKEERTRGIKVVPWDFTNGNGQKINVQIWDFGGQDVYYPVHRFFLTEQSLYVLLATTRHKQHNFDYWIPIIRMFGGLSPILIVQNCHDGNREPYDFVYHYTSNPHFNIVQTRKPPYFEINLPKQNEGLADLENAICFQIQQLEHIGKPILSNWVRVREALLQRSKEVPHLSFRAFENICKSCDITEKEKIRDVGKYLHEIGIILWYRQFEALEDFIILRAEWATNAVYQLIDDEAIQSRRGLVLWEDVERLWSDDLYADKKKELINLMKAFKVCYRKKHKKEFIIPARLLPMSPDLQWKGSDYLRLEYQYQFMPRGIVNQLTAQMSRYIEDDEKVYNNAVVFKHEQAQAQVFESYELRKILILSKGKDARGLMMLIMDVLRDIHDDYKGLEVTIQVPCRCSVCQKSEKPTLFSYNKLLEWSERKETVTCNESDEQLRIDNLLFMVGLPGRENRTRGIHFREEENEGLQQYLEILIKKQNAFLQDLGKVSDAPQKFKLEQDLEQLEKDIAATREKLQEPE